MNTKIKILSLTDTKLGKVISFDLSKSNKYVFTTVNKNKKISPSLIKFKYDIVIIFSEKLSAKDIELTKLLRNNFDIKLPFIFVLKEIKLTSIPNETEGNNIFFNYNKFDSKTAASLIDKHHKDYKNNILLNINDRLSDFYYFLNNQNINEIKSAVKKSDLFNYFSIISYNDDDISIIESHFYLNEQIKNKKDIHNNNLLKFILENNASKLNRLDKNVTINTDNNNITLNNILSENFNFKDKNIIIILSIDEHIDDNKWNQRILQKIKQKYISFYNKQNEINESIDFSDIFNTLSFNLSGFLAKKHNNTYKITHLSPNFGDITGIKKEDLYKINNWKRYTSPNHHIHFPLYNSKELFEKGFCEKEIQFNTKDHNWLKLQLYVYKQNKQEFIVGLFYDISKQKEYELKLLKENDELKKQQVDKSNFLAKLSHDIRTSMNSVLGFSNILTSQELNRNKIVKFGDLIKKSANELLHKIDNILLVSMIDAQKLTFDESSCNLNYFINGIYLNFENTFKTNNEIDFLKIIPENKEDIILSSDIKKIEDTFKILINNALNNTLEGTISIGYEISDDKQKLIFFVKDTGIGYTEAQVEKLFSRFRYTSKDKEKDNLELAIAKSMIEFLGGELTLETDFNEGTDFYFSFDYKSIVISKNEKDTILIEQKTKKAKRDLSKLNIIVAEDDPGSAVYINEILSKLNAKITFVENGALLMSHLRKNIPDLILLDLKMPKKDGIECLEEIQKNRIKTKIIVQTAFSYSGERQRVKTLGANYYIEKPIDKKELLHAIELLFDNDR